MKRIYTFMLLFVCFLNMHAQNLAVQSFRMDETDPTANTAGTTVIDQNGQKCALIKVETTQQGFSFDAGTLGVVKTEQKVGEIWVYVPEGVKRLTISHQQLGVLRDYDLGQTLKRAKTYILKLSSDNAQKTQKLIMNYTPTNAMVLIDSKPYKGNGHIEVALPLGNHNYIIAAEGYETVEGSFKLTQTVPRTVTEQLVAFGQSNLTSVEKPTTSNQQSQTSNNTPSPDIMNQTNLEILGANFREITNLQKEFLNINYGLEVRKVNNGALKKAGITRAFIIKKVNDEKVNSIGDFQRLVKEASNSKDPVLYIVGVYPTGKKAYFVVPLEESK